MVGECVGGVGSGRRVSGCLRCYIFVVFVSQIRQGACVCVYMSVCVVFFGKGKGGKHPICTDTRRAIKI